VLGGEATNTNCIVFGLTRSGLESTICRTRDDHANYYTIDAIIRPFEMNIAFDGWFLINRLFVLIWNTFSMDANGNNNF